MFSLIVPTLFKNKKFIISNLNKIAEYKVNLEIIVIFQKLSGKEFQINLNNFSHQNIKLFNIPNIGISVARNFGIKKSKYPWILLMDDDLIIKETTFVKLNHLLLRNDYSFYYCNTLVSKSNKNFLKLQAKSKFLNYFNFNRISSVSLIIHRSIFEKIGFFNEILGSGKYYGSSEETDLIFRALLNKIKISYIDNINFFHPKATMNKNKSIEYARGFAKFIKINYLKSNFKLKIILLYLVLFRLFFAFYPKPYNFTYLLAFIKVLFSNKYEDQ